MTKTQITFKSLEEMVTWVTGASWRTEIRWKLEDRTNWEWDDVEAGKAWEAKRAEVHDMPGYRDWMDETTAEQIAEYKVADEALRAAKPEQHLQRYWGLEESKDGYHKDYIYLTPEIGQMLDGIWTKKQSRYGSGMERTGVLTVQGMLKRLGKTDISDQLKAAQQAATALAEKNARNQTRRSIVAKATEIKKLQAELTELVKSNPALQLVGKLTIDDLMKLVEEA